MTRTIALSFACCALGLLAVEPLAAQLPGALSLEARLGGALATGALADPVDGVDAGAGYAAGISARWDATEAVAVYVGYERAGLACAACEDASLDGTVVDAGLGAGAILTLPSVLPGISPWVRAGVVRRQLRFSGGGETSASAPGLGFDLGAGVTLPLVASFSLTPGIRFLNYPAEFDFAIVPDRSVDVSHVGVDVGLVYQF